MADPSQQQSRARSTLVWVGIFLLLAFGLRFYFGNAATFDEESQRYLFTGNDPYYHWRIVDHILTTGEHLRFDEAINYPSGAYNPNPPMFSWTTAPVAGFLKAATDSPDPVGLALNIMVAVWGALTVIPVYHLARDLWGRRAGLWAAFFMAVSAPHIQRTVAGFADHDAATMFWIALAFAFMVKALRAARVYEYKPETPRGLAAYRGLYGQDRAAFRWAILAGLALTATAITWKGYPYALAVMAVGLAIQLVHDQLRRRDSRTVFLLYLVPLAMVAVLPWLLYYWAFPTFVDTTVTPSLYVLLGTLVLGAILVPSRHLPSILVFPALIAAGVLGWLLLYFVLPDVYYTVFSGLGYFSQSKLYSTIAEARRTELGYAAASFGFFTFLLMFWGFGRAVGRSFKGEQAAVLITAWSVVAIFMAFAASRFLMNAAPIFCVLIGGVMAYIGDRMGLSDVRRRLRARSGQGVAGAAGSLTWKSVLGVLAVGLLVVVPNAWLGVDAATPYEYENENDWNDHWTGAFGISVNDLTSGGWNEAMNRLAQLDTGLPLEERPAFIAWWDYGHWATGIGLHPTVADPFQHHYGIAGRFLASESEQEAMAWLTILLLNDDHKRNGGSYSAGVGAALDAADPGLRAMAQERGYDAKYRHFIQYVDVEQGGDEVFALYDEVTKATGRTIGYMAVDARMFPTESGGGIFYAPVYLANKNPDDFLQLRYITSGGSIRVQQYDVDAQNNSYSLDEPRYFDDSDVEYVVYNGLLFPKGRTPLQGFPESSGLTISTTRLERTDKYESTMYNRAFAGLLPADVRMRDGTAAAGVSAGGDGLAHWRTVHESTNRLSPAERERANLAGNASVRSVVLLEYYRGVTVTGRVVDDTGEAMKGVEVTFVDGFGAAHHANTTDDSGRYTVIAPFSDGDDLVLTVRQDGGVIQEDRSLQFTREQAKAGGQVPGPTITIPRGNLGGVVYRDLDGRAGYDAANDTAIAGANVTVAGRQATTGDDGRYRVEGLQAGTYSVRVGRQGYENTTRSVTVNEVEERQDLALRVSQVETLVRLTDAESNEGLSGLLVEFDGPTKRDDVFTNATGFATTRLDPGSYTVTVNQTYVDQETGLEVRYLETRQLTINVGDAQARLEIAARRQ